MDRSDDVADDKPKPRRARRRGPDDEERPRRKKVQRARGSPLLLWGLVGGGAAVVLAGVVIGAVLIMNGRQGSSSTPSPGNPAAGPPGKSSAEATIEIKADVLARDLVAHLQDNEGFRRKYSGRALLVEGTVKHSGESMKVQGEYAVLLVGHTEPGLGEVIVACVFKGSEIAEARKLKWNEPARIACKLSPLSGNAKGVVLEDCRVVAPR
jgi:hypothetical protein